MEQSIFLGRELLGRSSQELQNILADHTGSPRAAADLVVSLDQARNAGELSHCLLRSRMAASAASPEGEWSLEVVYQQ